MSFENMELETIALSNHPQFLAIIEHSRQRQQHEGGLTSEQMRARLAIKPEQRNHRKVNHD